MANHEFNFNPEKFGEKTLVNTQTTNRIDVIRQRLTQTLNPTTLEIIDESYKHVGHAGAQSGAGHYAIVIESEAFVDKSEIEKHKLIYGTLNDLIPHEVHALSIKTKASS